MAIPAPSAPTTSPGAIAVGILILIGGIVGLGIAAVVSHGVSSYNQGCAQIPQCSPQSDPSGGIVVFAVIAMIVGGVAIAYGARGYFSNSS
ncbi:MAG TPA: hypothetical protein VML94_08370 [Thermoplasmata archaeon]|nr:hypothetical protein [Thermoplasmata archaeon]